MFSIPLFDKSTNQTGMRDGLKSSNAIDRKLYDKINGEQFCAGLQNLIDLPAEWWIDLGEVYDIHSVTLHNTGTSNYEDMKDFAIRVYKPDVESPVTCVKYPGAVGKAANITLICQHDVYGRYIKFIRLGGVHLNKVTLCEVEIKGKLHPGLYQHLTQPLMRFQVQILYMTHTTIFG
ncbi:hypothetical protein LSH36_1206g00044 [Paralvinella palmiformis]|uniref:Fucolectin tachylectin-4 pentraxin-1 domain-containing protein n=1 Tax=Paralvinella palmiformis TaxID=53620 RepID=A0AAD9MR94_9ANNE|nr:hypothetical protein LSH36_1206g00044 [Paralvinella palmiformis]